MDTYSAVILAGGKSRRMGRDKLALELDGLTLLESAVERFSRGFAAVYISVADAGKYPGIMSPRVVDAIPGAGPLSGLHAALSQLPCDGVFLVAADLPFSRPDAALRIIELCGGRDAAVIELADGKIEPLFGYYRKSLLPSCEAALASGDFRMSEVLRRGDARYVSPGELGGLWDERLIFNVNFPDDFRKATIEFLPRRMA